MIGEKLPAPCAIRHVPAVRVRPAGAMLARYVPAWQAGGAGGCVPARHPVERLKCYPFPCRSGASLTGPASFARTVPAIRRNPARAIFAVVNFCECPESAVTGNFAKGSSIWQNTHGFSRPSPFSVFRDVWKMTCSAGLSAPRAGLLRPMPWASTRSRAQSSAARSARPAINIPASAADKTRITTRHDRRRGQTAPAAALHLKDAC